MDKPVGTAFTVLARPFVVWSYDAHSENVDFLNSIDSNFYHRAIQTLFCDDEGKPRFDAENNKARKDVSSLVRLIWNHGLETLVTLLGAYIQAPHVVHGFFLKCKNEDCRTIAKCLLTGQIPESNCLTLSEFDFDAFVRGIHLRSVWVSDEATMSNFSRALKDMLRAYDRDDHRAEYNSIKHGLRAHHGRFALAFGPQEEFGVSAPDENIQMVADTADGSHFLTIKTFDNVPKKTAREQFSTQHGSVGWSLERTIFDIQLLSILIANVVSALKIAAGAKVGTVQFFRPEVGTEWWTAYFDERGSGIFNFSSGENFEIQGKLDEAEKQAAKFYRVYANARRQAGHDAD